MITPAYSLTATERVLPRLTLNFMSGVLDSRIAVTRALNTATRINSSGYIEAVNADLPRFDYDPVTLAPKGLLIEETRANLALQSNAFTTSPWLSSAGISIASASATSPDGTVNGWLWTRSSTAASFTTQTITKAASAITYTTSYYVKKSVGDFCAIRLQGSYPSMSDVVFNISTGTISSAAISYANFSGASATIQPVGNGWYRVTLSATSDTHTGIQSVVSFNSNGVVIDGTDSVSNSAGYLYGAQLETGAFATSYIPTTTTSLTRNADVVQMTGTNFSSWYNAAKGTFRADAISRASGVSPIISADDNTANNSLSVVTDATTPKFIVTQSGSEVANVSAGTITANVAMFAYVSYAQDYFGIARPSARQVDTSGSVPTADRLRIGSNQAGNYANGHIQQIQFWP